MTIVSVTGIAIAYCFLLIIIWNVYIRYFFNCGPYIIKIWVHYISFKVDTITVIWNYIARWNQKTTALAGDWYSALFSFNANAYTCRCIQQYVFDCFLVNWLNDCISNFLFGWWFYNHISSYHPLCPNLQSTVIVIGHCMQFPKLHV